MRAGQQLTISGCVALVGAACLLLCIPGCSKFSLTRESTDTKQTQVSDKTTANEQTAASTLEEDDLNAKIQAHADLLLAALERQQAQQRAKEQAAEKQSRITRQATDPEVERLAVALDQHARENTRSSEQTQSEKLPEVQWLDLTPAPKTTPQPVNRLAKTQPATVTVTTPVTTVVPTTQVPIVHVASTTQNQTPSNTDTNALTQQLTQSIRNSSQTPIQKALALSSLSLSSNQNLLLPDDLKELDSAQMQQVRKMHMLVLQTLAKQQANGKASDDQQSAMNDQITKLFGPATTRIGKVEFCRNVSGYGVYEPFESTTFLAGVEQPLILYVELENFNSLFDGQQYRVRLSQQVSLYTDADGVRVWNLPQEEIIDVSRNKRRDFFTVQLLHLPARLGVGKYRLKVRIHDINAGSYDEVAMPITLIATQNTTARSDDKPAGNVRSN